MELNPHAHTNLGRLGIQQNQGKNSRRPRKGVCPPPLRQSLKGLSRHLAAGGVQELHKPAPGLGGGGVQRGPWLGEALEPVAVGQQDGEAAGT